MEDDLRQSTVVLRDIREKCKDALTHIQGLIKKAEEGEFDTSKVSIHYENVPMQYTDFSYSSKN